MDFGYFSESSYLEKWLSKGENLDLGVKRGKIWQLWFFYNIYTVWFSRSIFKLVLVM